MKLLAFGCESLKPLIGVILLCLLKSVCRLHLCGLPL